MKRVILFLSIFIFIVVPAVNTQAKTMPNMKIYVDKQKVTFPIAPEISKENRTFVPFRAIAESMGVVVNWIGSERKIIATNGQKQVELVIDKKQGFINGQAFELDSKPYITHGHTLIPLRFFSEAFGASVQWDGATNTVHIYSVKESLYTMSYYGLSAFEYRKYVPHFDGMAYMWSSISDNGTLNLNRRDNEKWNEFFWPEDHPLATADEIIQSGTKQGNDGYLMVAALSMEPIKVFLSNKGKQEVAIEEMIRVANSHHLNGILLDFEGFDEDDDEWRTKYTSFVKELSKQLSQEDMKLSVAVTPVNNHFNNYDYKSISAAADTIIVMSYGYNPVGTKQAEPMSNVEQGVKQTLQFISRDKMLLGINLVHESDISMKEKIELAQQFKLKGVSFWLLNQLNDERMDQIEQLTK